MKQAKLTANVLNAYLNTGRLELLRCIVSIEIFLLKKHFTRSFHSLRRII